jgi:hypothetical protein
LRFIQLLLRPFFRLLEFFDGLFGALQFLFGRLAFADDGKVGGFGDAVAVTAL